MALVALAILVLFGLLIIATSYPHDDKRSAPGYRPAKLPRPTNAPGRQLTKRAPAPGETHIAGYNDNPNIPAPKIERNKSMAQINVNDYINFSRVLAQIESDYFAMAKLTGQKEHFVKQRHEMFEELWSGIMEDEDNDR